MALPTPTGRLLTAPFPRNDSRAIELFQAADDAGFRRFALQEQFRQDLEILNRQQSFAEDQSRDAFRRQVLAGLLGQAASPAIERVGRTVAETVIGETPSEKRAREQQEFENNAAIQRGNTRVAEAQARISQLEFAIESERQRLEDAQVGEKRAIEKRVALLEEALKREKSARSKAQEELQSQVKRKKELQSRESQIVNDIGGIPSASTEAGDFDNPFTPGQGSEFPSRFQRGAEGPTGQQGQAGISGGGDSAGQDALTSAAINQGFVQLFGGASTAGATGGTAVGGAAGANAGLGAATAADAGISAGGASSGLGAAGLLAGGLAIAGLRSDHNTQKKRHQQVFRANDGNERIKFNPDAPPGEQFRVRTAPTRANFADRRQGSNSEFSKNKEARYATFTEAFFAAVGREPTFEEKMIARNNAQRQGFI